MTSPFEDPRKTEMRERLIVAVDAAGYEVVDEPVPVAMPNRLGLRGAILGDLQSLDADGIRYAYYIRPEVNKPLPQWLGNLARAAFEADGVRVYVVVDSISEVIERTARAAGAGLLLLTAENSLEHVVDPTELDADQVENERRQRVKELRRRMETKMNLRIKVLEEHYASVDELTHAMAHSKRDVYIRDAEAAIGRWQDWGEELDTMLDEALASGSQTDLDQIEEWIEEGVDE